MHRPRLALTLGDPAGIGPEIVAAAWAHPEVHTWCRPLAVGPVSVLRRAVALRGLRAEVVQIDAPEEAEPSANVIPCLACGPHEVDCVADGTIDGRAGQAAYQAVVRAARLALQKRVGGLVTAPLHKEALHRAGLSYPGHTELLAELCGAERFAMMLYLGPGEPLRSPTGLAVVHVTLHTALRHVFAALTEEAVLVKCRLVHQFMQSLGEQAPRIAVCALNPHAGEGGLFGEEEKRIIAPAVRRGLAEGLRLQGPLPADTVMVRARDGQFDAVVAMYHDQGHIAVKLLGMYRAVNVTLGLPIVRTSVAHGTAFDVAWQGRADERSMVEAIRVAARLARHPDRDG